MNKDVFLTDNTYFASLREIIIQSYLLLMLNALRKAVIATKYNIVRFSIVRYSCIIWQIKDAFICTNGRKSAKLINTRIRSNCSNESNGLGDQNVVHLYKDRL